MSHNNIIRLAQTRHVTRTRITANVAGIIRLTTAARRVTTRVRMGVVSLLLFFFFSLAKFQFIKFFFRFYYRPPPVHLSDFHNNTPITRAPIHPDISQLTTTVSVVLYCAPMPGCFHARHRVLCAYGSKVRKRFIKLHPSNNTAVVNRGMDRSRPCVDTSSTAACIPEGRGTATEMNYHLSVVNVHLCTLLCAMVIPNTLITSFVIYVIRANALAIYSSTNVFTVLSCLFCKKNKINTTVITLFERQYPKMGYHVLLIWCYLSSPKQYHYLMI